MNFFYNSFPIHSLGDVTITQAREYEDGQRIKVTLKLGVTLNQRSYGDNYSLVQQLQTALQTMESVFQWTNTDNGQDYLNQTVSTQSNDLPEEWGEYQQQFNLVFYYYEQNLVTNNLPLTIAGATGNPMVLGNVSKFIQTVTTERFSTFHSQRNTVRGKLAVSGYILSDTTQSLAQRRTAMLAVKAGLDIVMNNNMEGTLQFGPSGSVFNGLVRVEEYSSEIDELKWQLPYTFTASYTIFPNEKTFATVEYEANQKEALQPATGEQFLSLTGKITAATEAIARTKLAAITTTALTQYGYLVQSQQLRNDSTAKNISANTDGDFFTELNFILEYRRFRADNQLATFTKTGSKKAIPFGNVEKWTLQYSARRFNDQRSQRSHAGGQINAMGTWLGDPALSVVLLRAQILAMQTAMYNEVNGADGTLAYGAFSQVVRMDDLKAEINQALTGIDWSFTAIYSNFPNESGYATSEFSVTQTSNVEDGEQTLAFSGSILAPDEALARAQLSTLRTTMLTTYAFVAAQQLKVNSVVKKIYANGDKTANLSAVEAADGTTFIELTFSEDYRQRMSNLLGFTMQISSRTDIATGLVMTTYSGSVTAGALTVDAAYTAALVKAQALGGGRQVQLGLTAFQRTSVITWDQRQTQATNSVEFVKLTFAYEYQGRMPVGNAYIEMSTDWATETFGNDSVSVSGYIIAVDAPTGKGLFASTILSVYAGMIIHGQSLKTASITANADGTPSSQDIRVDFSFTAFVPKAVGTVNYRYAINTANDYLQLDRKSNIRGSVYCITEAAAVTAVNALLLGLGLGSLIADSNGVDHEYTSASTLDLFLKYDFDASYVARLTGIANLLEMKVTESVKFSGTRWVVQPIPRAANGTGGVSIPQDCGLEPGSRTVRGSVTAASQITAVAWARQQRALLTGDDNGNNYPQPEDIETEYEFVPRIDGVILGATGNVKLYRVSFGFSEILPFYPPTN